MDDNDRICKGCARDGRYYIVVTVARYPDPTSVLHEGMWLCDRCYRGAIAHGEQFVPPLSSLFDDPDASN